MKLLLDTNVVLDVLLARAPHMAKSAKVLGACEAGKIEGFVAGTSVTTLYYLIAKAAGKKVAGSAVERLLDILNVAEVNLTVLRTAMNLGMPDYEDAVLHEAAVYAGCNGIVTPNLRDFRPASLKILSPEDVCLAMKL